MMEFQESEQDREDFKQWLNNDKDAKYERDAKIMFYLVAFGLVAICCGMFYLLLR